MNSVGATSLGWGHAPLNRVFDELAELGGEVVEVNSRPGQHGITLEGPQVSQVRRWALSSGITISSVAGYNDFAAPVGVALDAQIDRLMTACQIAAGLEAPVVRAFAADATEGVEVEAIWPQVVGAFQRVAERVGPLGVTVGIENHGRLVNDGAMLARLVGEIGSDRVGLNVDTGNFAWAGHDREHTRQDLAAALPKAVNVHIKDLVWEGDGSRFVAAGDGSIGVADIVQQLQDRGYQGALLSEYEGSDSHLDGTKRSIAFLDHVRQPSA
jgi:sugar phosphate isomerase/epimerase